MLSTPVLDVAIGLSLFYLLLGLICTTVNEMIAGWTKSRASFLDKGIGRLLGDNLELKKLLYEHPLIQSLSQTAKSAAQTQGAMNIFRVSDLPGRRAEIHWDAVTHPVVMLRDSKTGEVRGFLRGGDSTIEDVPESLELQLSDGVKSNVVLRNRPNLE